MNTGANNPREHAREDTRCHEVEQRWEKLERFAPPEPHPPTPDGFYAAGELNQLLHFLREDRLAYRRIASGEGHLKFDHGPGRQVADDMAKAISAVIVKAEKQLLEIEVTK